MLLVGINVPTNTNAIFEIPGVKVVLSLDDFGAPVLPDTLLQRPESISAQSGDKINLFLQMNVHFINERVLPQPP